MQIENCEKTISCGISFRKEILDLIDKERGDIPRSKFLFRLIEYGLSKKKNVDNNNTAATRKNRSVDQGLEGQNQQIDCTRGQQ